MDCDVVTIASTVLATDAGPIGPTFMGACWWWTGPLDNWQGNMGGGRRGWLKPSVAKGRRRAGKGPDWLLSKTDAGMFLGGNGGGAPNKLLATVLWDEHSVWYCIILQFCWLFSLMKSLSNNWSCVDWTRRIGDIPHWFGSTSSLWMDRFKCNWLCDICGVGCDWWRAMGWRCSDLGIDESIDTPFTGKLPEIGDFIGDGTCCDDRKISWKNSSDWVSSP